VVDVSSYEPRVSDHSRALAFALTVEAARSIEERLFRHVHRRAWILSAIAPTRSQPILLAIENDERVVGADRHARAALDIDDRQLAAGLSLWRFFLSFAVALCLEKRRRLRQASRASGTRRLGRWSSLHRCRRAPLHSTCVLACGAPGILRRRAAPRP